MGKKSDQNNDNDISIQPASSPQVDGRIPNAPRELDDTAQAYWRTYTKALQSAGLLFTTDLETLADLCYWESLKIRARDELPVNSLFIEYRDEETDRITHSQAHASFSNLKTIQQMINKLREKLGLTLRDRSGLKIARPAQPATDKPSIKSNKDW